MKGKTQQELSTSLQLLTYRQVAKQLGVELRTVYNLIRFEGLPIVYLRPHLPRIDEQDLRAWIEQRKVS